MPFDTVDKLLFDSSVCGIIEFRIYSKNLYGITDMNQEAEKITGYDINEILSLSHKIDISKMIYDEDVNIVINEIASLVLTGKSEKIEYRIISRSGDIHWISGKFILVENTDFVESAPSCIINSFVCIDDRKEAEENLRHSAIAYNLLRDSYYRISYVNLKKDTLLNLKLVEGEYEYEKKFKGKFSDVVKYCGKRLVYADDGDTFIQLLSPNNLLKLFKGKKEIVSFSYQRLVDGKYMWVQSDIIPLDDYTPDKPRVVWYVKNITEKKAEEAKYNQMILQKNVELMNVNEELNKRIALISSLSEIYISCYDINMSTGYYNELKAKTYVHNIIPKCGDAAESLEYFVDTFVSCEYREEMEKFIDLSTLDERLNGEQIISMEYAGTMIRWGRVGFVPVYCDDNGKPVEVLFISQDISNEIGLDSRMARQFYEDLQDKNKNLAKLNNELEKEKRQYHDALTINSEFSFSIDLNTGMLTKDIQSRTGKSYVDELGVELPININEFNRKYIEVNSLKFIDPEREKLWFTPRLLNAFDNGENNIEVEFYLPASDRYLKTNTLMSRDEVTGHVNAFVIGNDITDIRKKEENAKKALMEAYEAANFANAAKTDFLSNMSHDIRTPMNAIIGMTAIALNNLDDKEKIAYSLKRISSSGRHLLGLINEVLDMSKIESGKMNLNDEEFKLSELFMDILDMVRPQAAKMHHDLRVRLLDVEHEEVIGDRMRIQQAFVNIIGNAIKYTPEGGKIAITVSEKRSRNPKASFYKFDFKDNGIGMSEEYITHIFEPFSRAEDSRVNRIQGTGLGMPITRNILRMMNGDLQVKSELGKGSVFTATMLLKLQDTETVDVSELHGLSVLVVDDDRISCESMCDMLDGIGMKSEWTSSGREAVEKIVKKHEKEDDYFSVIVDWQMPEMNGVDTAKAIRKNIDGNLPIIVMSAYDWSDIEYEAKAAGINAFLTKPIFRLNIINMFKHFVNGEFDNNIQQKTIVSEVDGCDFSGKRVLLVEDNMINREIAIEILKTTNIEVEEAENGKIAVEQFEKNGAGYYDIILMDIQMPVMNGYEATEKIRSLKREDAKYVPIIAMTANAFTEDVVNAKNAGMNEHIPKPIDLNNFIRTLKRWIDFSEKNK